MFEYFATFCILCTWMFYFSSDILKSLQICEILLPWREKFSNSGGSNLLDNLRTQSVFK